VGRVSVFRDVQIFLDDAPGVGEERPVSTDSGAIFVRLGDIVGANGDKAAVGNLKLMMELNKQFRLPAVLGTETSAAEDENHRMLSVQFGKLSPLRGVFGKLIVGEYRPWNDV
jgi:hypothetical protein